MKNQCRRHTRGLIVESLEGRQMLAVFLVTNTNPFGQGSLHQAVAQANHAANADGVDEIRFDNSLSGQIIQLQNTPFPPFAVTHLGITEGITIDASDLASPVRIQASPGNRVFQINARSDEVTFRNLEITGGSPAFGDGGGIRVRTGRLTLEDCTVTDNTAAAGGGVAVNQATAITPTYVSIKRSVISGNSAIATSGGVSARGGGLFVESSPYAGMVQIEDSSIVENLSAGDGGTAGRGQGGGAYIILNTNALGDNVDLELTSSTIANNVTEGEGGGVFVVAQSTNEIRTVNSTISGNLATFAASQGGGIYLAGYEFDEMGLQPTADFLNTTIANNHATSGGGIFVSAQPNGNTTVDVKLKNTIVARNMDSYGSDDDIAGVINVPQSSFNLIGSLTSSGGLSNNGVNLVGFDPKLTELADFGGPTLTHRALPGSLAIGTGKSEFAAGIPFDQRGAGFARIADDHQNPAFSRVDIGAVENVLCDLDHDTDCDTDDMRRLYDEIAISATTSLADLDANGVVDNADIDEWLEYAGTFNDKTYKRGDTNLDGNVDGPDATQFATNFGDTGLPDAYWDQGNFDGNASSGIFDVGGADYTQLALNFGHTSPSPIGQPSSSDNTHSGIFTQTIQRVAETGESKETSYLDQIFSNQLW